MPLKPSLPVPGLLQDGAQMVAHIRHSHGIKATMAVLALADRYPQWTPEFWKSALARARWDAEPRTRERVAAPTADVPPARARTILARNVVPYSYSAVRSWAARDGGGAVAAWYLEQACADPGYLGHRLSILLAFLVSWPVYAQTEHEGLWLDRLCEYLLACGFEPQAAAADGPAPQLDAVLGDVLERPGFFGHHAITLAWTLRLRDQLSRTQFGNALRWAAHAAATTYDDAEDNVVVTASQDTPSSPAALEQALQRLLTAGQANIHLLTLADAIALLWDHASDAQRPYLLALASST
ncbi:hypothetical protein LZ009_08110 [Ramlibacter sp. XY19]|uniref:hypothetical protein n=1 Tax=Ramlibacter paludis TaxID=2908000 RepID=UPI0023DB6C71|nr:hypothetical protein [Ramlibacter paludis]MCG2592745.1 hypothetical protein [Ramlibacter paludis]